jgi:predicted tellurium resistance membrane protein TerC
MKNKYIILSMLVLIVLVFISSDLAAQCPMCKMSAESNLNDGGTAGKGLNKGILYMFAMPYLLVGTLGYLWWRNKRDMEGEN